MICEWYSENNIHYIVIAIFQIGSLFWMRHPEHFSFLIFYKMWCSFALVIVVVLRGRQKILESRKGNLKSDENIVIPRLRSECRGTFWSRQRRWSTSGRKKAVSVSKNSSISTSDISLLCKLTWKKLAIVWGVMDVNIWGWRHWKRV